MEQLEPTGPSAGPWDDDDNELVSHVSAAAAATDVPTPQACTTCGTRPAVNGLAAGANSSAIMPDANPQYVYAIGKIEARFPRLSVEKELAQVAARSDTGGLTDQQVLQAVLSSAENRYLARQMCWVMTIEGLETYIVLGRESADISLLVETLRSKPTPSDLDVVIGVKGPIAPPHMCNGLLVPIVVIDQLYSFDREALIGSIPKPDKIPAREFTPAAEELFDRIIQMTDNAGATDEHRALNYLAMRDRRIYEAVAEAYGRNESLSAVDVLLSPLSGTRKVVNVILSFTNRNTDVVSKQYVGVDVTEMYPFLQWKLRAYYDR